MSMVPAREVYYVYNLFILIYIFDQLIHDYSIILRTLWLKCRVVV